MTVAATNAATPPPAKDNPKYWSKRVVRRATAGHEAVSFSVRLRHKGHREWFTLDTGNREIAARKAAEIYRRVVAVGWEQVLREQKQRGLGPRSNEAPKTVGEFIEIMEESSGLSASTLCAYISKTVTLVSKIMGIDGGKAKHNHYRRHPDEKTPNELWRQRIYAVRLADLTAPRITQWRQRALAALRNESVEQEAARNSIISDLRSARSFFAPSNTEGLVHQPADPRPFTGFKIGTSQVRRYVSVFSAKEVMAKAREEMASANPSAYIILHLAVLAGLRRGEIDRLKWSQVDFARGVVNVLSSASSRTKTPNSEQGVEVGDDLLALLQGRKGRNGDAFVIAPDCAAIGTFKPNWRYRCHSEFKFVIKWLRENGVTTRNPLQALRKEFGSVINRMAGIHAASVSLRHRDIALTAKFYVDSRLKTKVSLKDLD